MTTQTIIAESCIFCRTSKLEILIPGKVLSSGVKVFKCSRCGLVFLESRGGELDPEETLYWDNEEQKKIYLQEGIRGVFVKEFEKRLNKIEALVGHKTGNLLDVGCGMGHFLEIARTRGWKAKGLDISEAASQAAKETYSLEVRVGTLENAPFESSEFDVITLWDVIEHIRRPIENMRAANRIIRKGGIVVLKTPDEESFFKQAGRTCYKLFGKRGSFLLNYVYYTPHYFSYTKRTIEMLLRRSGFELLEFEQDETPLEFAREKINVHYRKDPLHHLVNTLLPIAQSIARMFGRSNKMIVYARKVREVGE
ncbi:MAG: class I SAM-dependent methyltransferase [Candidatus Omnitrophica bacterium]|nr:class I SAM-dependent methyltransferase [Candidatus Omnitrophota bacterium]